MRIVKISLKIKKIMTKINLRNYINYNDNENESNNAKANDRISKILIEKENKIKALEEEIIDLKEKYNSLDND